MRQFGALVLVICFSVSLAQRPLSDVDLYTRFREAQKVTCSHQYKDTADSYNKCMSQEEKSFKYNLQVLRSNCMSFYPMNTLSDMAFMCKHVHETGVSSNNYYRCMISNIQRLTQTNAVEELFKTEKAVAKCDNQVSS